MQEIARRMGLASVTQCDKCTKERAVYFCGVQGSTVEEKRRKNPFRTEGLGGHDDDKQDPNFSGTETMDSTNLFHVPIEVATKARCGDQQAEAVNSLRRHACKEEKAERESIEQDEAKNEETDQSMEWRAGPIEETLRWSPPPPPKKKFVPQCRITTSGSFNGRREKQSVDV